MCYKKSWRREKSHVKRDEYKIKFQIKPQKIILVEVKINHQENQRKLKKSNLTSYEK